MTQEHPSRKSDRRVNVYLKAHEVDLLREVGEALHRDGIPGMLDSDGNPNNSAIVRHLLNVARKVLEG